MCIFYKVYGTPVSMFLVYPPSSQNHLGCTPLCYTVVPGRHNPIPTTTAKLVAEHNQTADAFLVLQAQGQAKPPKVRKLLPLLLSFSHSLQPAI